MPITSFDLTDDVTTIWCAKEAAASVAAGAIATAAAATFAGYAVACAADVGSVIYAAWSGDWSSLDPTMSLYDDCKNAATWYKNMNTTATAASAAAAALTNCVMIHMPIILELPTDGGSGGGGGGGGSNCQEWDQGFYDDTGTWWTLDSWQTCLAT
jgi:hypothetical protein